MVISISVLSFYSDGFYFSLHVVDVLQSSGLAIVTVVDPSSIPFSPLWISWSYFFISGKCYFSFVWTPFAHIRIPKTKEKLKITRDKKKYIITTTDSPFPVDYFSLSLGFLIITILVHLRDKLY